MCTVSVVPYTDGVRLISNRDERRARAAARPPIWWRLGAKRALFPLDPDGGGTWVGLNDSGLIVALLNRTEAGASRRQDAVVRSRGVIVPTLLTASGLPDVLRRVRRIRRADYRAFQVIAVCAGVAVIVTAGSDRYIEVCRRLEAPLLLTSSALGDAVVDAPRRQLFANLMSGPPAGWLEAQRRFHAHAWPARPDVSVIMSRHDARTVSRTICDARVDGGVRLTYEPLDDSAAVRRAS